jgi:hypothetical protein
MGRAACRPTQPARIAQTRSSSDSEAPISRSGSVRRPARLDRLASSRSSEATSRSVWRRT